MLQGLTTGGIVGPVRNRWIRRGQNGFKVTPAGESSNPLGSAPSLMNEIFGFGTIIADTVRTSQGNATVFGAGCSVSSIQSAALGARNTIASGGQYNVAVGYSNTTAAFRSTVIGALSTGAQDAIVFGLQMTGVANQCTIGADIRELVVGRGDSSATAANVTLQVRGSNGSGSNNAGMPVALSAGRSSGNATPAPLKLRSTAAGASGATLQTLVDVVEITNSLTVTITDDVDVVLGSTNGTQWGTANTQKQAWWGATPVVQQVLPTGSTTDQVIGLLQTLGLCRQS